MSDLEDMRERYAARPQVYAAPYVKALEAKVERLRAALANVIEKFDAVVPDLYYELREDLIDDARAVLSGEGDVDD